MNTMKLSAAVTAALLAGALATTAFAAETPHLAVGDGSVTFTKAISLEKADGAGGIKGNIDFAVSALTDAEMPTELEDGARAGSVDQLTSTTVTAVFTPDAQGKVSTESSVTVGLDLSRFDAPGVYYYKLTEQDAGITGLKKAGDYLLKVRVVNDNESNPDGKTFKIDYAVLASGSTKTAEVVNEYTTHTLTVTKELAGDFASYSDVFDFTLTFTDPDAAGHAVSATMRSGTPGGQMSEELVQFGSDGTASITGNIKGGQVIEVAGLPEGTTYTIVESGTAADKYTTAWTTAAGQNVQGKTLENQRIGAADAAVTVTNSRDSVAPTGLLLDAAPYGAMLALAAGGGAVFFRKRRKA